MAHRLHQSHTIPMAHLLQLFAGCALSPQQKLWFACVLPSLVRFSYLAICKGHISAWRVCVHERFTTCWVNRGSWVAPTATCRGSEDHAFYMVFGAAGHSTYRLGASELQDGKLSAF